MKEIKPPANLLARSQGNLTTIAETPAIFKFLRVDLGFAVRRVLESYIEFSPVKLLAMPSYQVQKGRGLATTTTMITKRILTTEQTTTTMRFWEQRGLGIENPGRGTLKVCRVKCIA
jgi:hypothetical protein